MKMLKTVLMWYSGFMMTLVLIGVALSFNTPTDCTPTTTGENIFAIVLFAPVVIYVFWEIVDHLKEQKK
ncbi:MAG: hypothetical protein PHW75_01985 [Patescibacteria group bacterium]|nr:hypothetical protein [Patescibacteria group bacterium]